LMKISEQYPQKTYNRIQATTLCKLDEKLQNAMQTMMEKKRKKFKLQKTDKREADIDDANLSENKDKNQEILSNEHRLKIIEKALLACNQQLIYFNKLFLRPIVSENVQNNQQQSVANQKAMKTKLDDIKRQIDEKRKRLMQQIEHLNALRIETQKIDIAIPQMVKDKLVCNMDYDNSEQAKEQMDVEKEDQTRQILSMMDDNKKEKMMNLKQMFDELKTNELRLKDKAWTLEQKDAMLQRFVELRRKNQIEEEEEDCFDENTRQRKNNRVSLASSITSTIHGSVSPFLFEQLQQNKPASGKDLNFKIMQEIEKGNAQMYEHNDIDL